jgi:hypothetical protein
MGRRTMTTRITLPACLDIAVKFLNANFAPWTFEGDEPVAVALAALFRDLMDENEALRRQLDSITPDVVPHLVTEQIPIGQTIQVRVPRRFLPRDMIGDVKL